MVQDKVAQKQNELNATYDEKLRNYEQRYVFTACSMGIGFECLPVNRIFSVSYRSSKPSFVTFVRPMSLTRPNFWIKGKSKVRLC
jgi:hypothetical protein